MVTFHGKPLCFCGSDLQTGSQFLHVQANIRVLVSFHGKPLCFYDSDLQTASQFLHMQDNTRSAGIYIRGTMEELTCCLHIKNRRLSG